MKKLNNCEVKNCIPTPTSCAEWDGGDIDYLGICNGDSLNDLLLEIITKLQEIAGEDLSSFDIDSLLEICNQQAPAEVTLISILTLMKNDIVCLKDFIDDLNERLNELFAETDVNVNLKCYAEFDNLGNSLSITRDQLDQLIIDNLCNHKQKIESLEGSIINLQSQIDNLDLTPDPTEMNVATCVDPVVSPVSSQIVTVAQELCDLQDATGDPGDISSALANTPAGMNAEFGLLPGWNLTPANWAENYSNLLIAFGNVWARLQTIEDTCCALTCADIELGFSAVYNEDTTGIILRFTFGAGTSIPAGVTDQGSTGTITDIDGNIVEFNIVIANNLEEEIAIVGLNTGGPLVIDITAILGTDSLSCQKCLSKTVSQASCRFCEICVEGEDGSSVVVIYESSKTGTVIENSTTTTTTSTTTTTTSAP